MDREIIILSEVNQKEKDKYHMISFICGIQNMTQMNLSMKEKQSHRHREQTCGCGCQVGRGDELGVWGQQMQTSIHRMDKQQGLTVQYRAISCDKPQWKRI